MRSAKERGASASWSPKARAEFASDTIVQSITSFWLPTPDHSTKQMAMRRFGPEAIALSTRGSEIAAA